MVRGEPGVGKTAVGFHFLAEGVKNGEPVLFLTQGATVDALRQDADSIGISSDGIDFLDFTPEPEIFSEGSTGFDVFAPSAAESETYTRRVIERVEELRPTRVFLDALTQGRHLASDIVEFRRQAHAFLRFLVGSGATVVFASGSSDHRSDEDLQFISDGVIHLEYSPEARGRVLSVSKLRGSRFRLGRHSLRIGDHGIELFPRLVPEAHGRRFEHDQIASGNEGLDRLLGGGVERGTVTMITGPTGVGKTTIGVQLLLAAAARGERTALYTFEEGSGTLLARCRGLGLEVDAALEADTFKIVEAEPLNYTPEEFALEVRREVEEQGARVVMIDGVAGYKLSVHGEDIVAHLHALCRYLINMGATVICIYETSAVTGEFRASEVGLSYLTDNILYLRYVEIDGELRRVIGVLKKRMSDFEKSLRELSLSPKAGIVVGEPLKGFRGILRGAPQRESNGG